jgi:alkylation response protein AidB-like acyl-CoA dehydrogenase
MKTTIPDAAEKARTTVRPDGGRRDPVAAATELHDRLGTAGVKAEADRRLPAETVEELRSAGLYSLTLPRALGGVEADPRTIIETVAILAHADPSVGWNVLIGQGSGFLAWLPPAVADGIVRRTPDPIVLSSFAPLPPAVPGPDGYRLNGVWPYCSGSPAADWAMGAFLAPRPDAPPRMRYAFVPAEALTVTDSWDPMGLAGTGSHHVTVAGVTVPPDRIVDPRTEAAHQPGRLYRLSLFSLLMVCMAGFPLGVGRRALDEIGALAARKSRSSNRAPLAEDPLVQAELMKAEAALRAARAGVERAVDDLWTETMSDGPVDVALRAGFAASVDHAMSTAVSVVDTAFRLAGGGALQNSGMLQRCWRDLQVGATHVVFGPDRVRLLGRALLGLDVPAEAL